MQPCTVVDENVLSNDGKVKKVTLLPVMGNYIKEALDYKEIFFFYEGNGLIR